MGIDHIALFCKDLEEMRQFFIDHFSALSNEQYHNPRTGLRTYILSFPDGGARLEVMQRPDTVDADLSKLNIGFVHVSFAVGSSDAVDSKNAELADAGYKVASGPRTTGDGYYESCAPMGISSSAAAALASASASRMNLSSGSIPRQVSKIDGKMQAMSFLFLF